MSSGFSFWKSPLDQTGLQNFLFAVFMGVVLAVRLPRDLDSAAQELTFHSYPRSQAPLSQQLQPKFLGLRQLFEARENASKMYSWPIFVITAIIVEIPFNIFACVLLNSPVVGARMMTDAFERTGARCSSSAGSKYPPLTLISMKVRTNWLVRSWTVGFPYSSNRAG